MKQYEETKSKLESMQREYDDMKEGDNDIDDQLNDEDGF